MRRFLLWALAAVILVILIFYAEEDWRGARDWAACQRELTAKGETLDLRQLVPPGKPEDDLSKVPIFADNYEKPLPAESRIRQIKVYFGSDKEVGRPKAGAFMQCRPVDLGSWQKYYRSLPDTERPVLTGSPAQDVLRILSRFDEPMGEVDAAVSKPKAYFPMNYETPISNDEPIVSTSLIAVAQVLQLRAVAHLEDGEMNLAAKDYLASFRMEEPLFRQDTAIDYLVAVGIRAVDETVLWEGLRRHAWSDAQLREMELELGATDMIDLAVKSLRVERAMFVPTLKTAQSAHMNFIDGLYSRENAGSKLGHLGIAIFLRTRPSGWEKEEQIFMCREMQNELEATRKGDGTMDRKFYDTWVTDRPFDDLRTFNHLYAIEILTTHGPRFGVQVARAETNRRLARLACRLEEYRLAHGNHYPDKLDDLPDLPAHLNQEVFSDAPLHYQRKGAGYLLYSVGWNQTDEGGYVAADKTEGDWVWPSP